MNLHPAASICAALFFGSVIGCQAQPPSASTPSGAQTLLQQASPAATGGALDKDSIVQAKLIADTTAIKPGTTFTLGVVYTMQPDWHIYWKNPGASGFATTVEWGLPPGASVSETLYPAPLRLNRRATSSASATKAKPC